MNIIKPYLLVFLCMLMYGTTQAQITWKTRQFRISIDPSGRITELTAIATGKNYLPSGEKPPLLSVKSLGKICEPGKATWKQSTSELVLSYPEGDLQATLKVQQRPEYISMELKSLTRAVDAEWILWGPFPTTISDTIGEVVGVVRDRAFAIGIQALNIKTLGGHPAVDSDIQPSYDVFTDGNKVDVLKDDLHKQLFRGDVARHMPYGSLLQAYCRNRSKDRVIDNWSHPRYLAPAYTEDGGVAGSKLAIFGVPVAEALSAISTIELKEGLPHPMLDGVWGKTARHASESYFIMDFGTQNLQEALDITKQAGLRYLYHGDPFANWGHFDLKAKDFPQNWASLKECVDLAKAQQMRLGLHTLSNFITTNDAYVTPIPDPRLAKVGYAQLSGNIDAVTKDIVISDPSFFNQFDNNTLKAAVIGQEIIRYESISASAPWTLLNCQRGAFNTHASAHNAKDTIGKLMDHAYKVFLGNHSLDQEIALTLARLFNETGLMQISFDGLEGCYSEGMGDYGKQLFTQTWFNHLKPELQGKVINDASNPGHYFWHVYTRMNWGEPWYAGFRESQLQLRLKNQQFYRRNLMPSMLGWFSLKAETSVEDIEWMLARGAGFNAGFGLSSRPETINRHGRKTEILAAISVWETARMQNMFTDAQQQAMQDTRNEFHLQKDAGGKFILTPVHNAYFVHKQAIKQPGEPVFSAFTFDNPAAQQSIRFIMQLAPGKDTDPDVTFSQPAITVNQQNALTLPVTLKRNQILVCDGQSIKLYDKQWNLLQTVELAHQLPLLVNGGNQITFDGTYSGENGADVKMEVRADGKPETLQARR